MSCAHPRTKTWEVRRSKARGLRRRLLCMLCGVRFNTYGGATSAEVEKARAVLREKGYLQ